MIKTLRETGQRLEELTAGEVDSVADPEGRTYLLRGVHQQLRDAEAAEQAAILNALPAHIALLDSRGIIVSVNEAWRQFAEANALHSPGHAVGANYLEICDSARGNDAIEGREAASGIRSILLGAAKSFSLEYPCHSPAVPRWFLMTVTPLAGGHGAVVMHLNITDMKVAEQEITRNNQRLRENAISIKRLNRVRAVMSGINALIVREHDRDQLYREACRIAVEEGGFRMALIAIASADAMKIVPAASAGKDKALLSAIEGLLSSSEGAANTMVARAIREKQAVVANDSQHDPQVLLGKLYVASGVCSIAVLPLVVSGEATGALALYASEIDFFHEEELKLLTELAGDIAFALEHISKEEGITRLSRIQAVTGGINALMIRVHERQELFDGACRIAVEQGHFAMAWIGALDPVTQDVTPIAWAGEGAEELTKARSSARDDTPRGKGAVGQAIRARRPIHNNDVAIGGFGGPRLRTILRLGFRSQITLPLYEGPAVVGVFTMYAREPDFFDEEELRLLTGLARDISFAIENIGTRKRLVKLARIRAISSGINALIVRVHDRRELFDEACRIAVEQGNFEVAWIGSLDPVTHVVAPVAWAGLWAKEYLEKTDSSGSGAQPAAQGALNRAIRELQPVFCNDLSIEAGVTSLRRAEALRRGCRSLIVLPLIVDGEALGNLTLLTREADFFDDDEVKLLTDLAGDISFAIGNIGRREKLDKLERIRSISSEINAVIVRIRDRDALLRAICRIAVEHGKFELVWIASMDMEKQEVRPIAWAGFSPEAARAVSCATISTTQGTLNEAMLTRKPAVRNDAPAGRRGGLLWQEALKKDLLSTVCLPLLVDDSVVALIVLFGQGAGFFDDDELTLLGEVSADVSFALQAIEKQAKLEYLSHYDVLTGLPNRTLFNDALRKTLALASDRGWLVAVLWIDLDYFKNVNDTLGHPIGDELLTQFSARLLQCVRIRDTVGRLSGDEFALILLMEDGKEGAAHVANKIRDALSTPFDLKGHEVVATASIGITIHPDDASDPDTLMKYADTAMYRAKQAGRDTFRFFTAQMNAEVVARLDLETALRKAIDNDEFVLHYQPKVQLSTGRISGLEALLRWHRPGHGLVSPKDFIPVLEETGLILRVGSWVVATACKQVGHWMRSPIGPVPVSVNVSGRQFIDGDLRGDVVKALADNGIAANLLELEMTESSLMANTERTIASLRNLKKLGVQLSIDDFGTGYSSLAYLNRFPIDVLKIDIAFIRDVTNNPDHAAIVLAIIRMAHGLRLDVVAEGVETAAQLAYLRRHHCDVIQGYYFSRPLPVPELEQMLREQKCLPGPEKESGAQRNTLLLVDDDAAALAMLQRTLREDGYRILSARSAAEGFELLALHAVQVILCDQTMPGMSGTVFLDQVKDLYPDTFRIVLSGHTDLESIMDAINRGAIHRYYTKDWSDPLARENVREAFRQHRLLHAIDLQGANPVHTLPPGQLARMRARQLNIPAPMPVRDKP